VIQNIGIIPDVQIEDLTVIKNKTDEDVAMIEPIKEYQLKNHLAGTAGSGTGNTNNPDAADMGLAHDDFQLFEAVKILRTMYTLNQMGQTMQSATR
jgi:hypothetical protein